MSRDAVCCYWSIGLTPIQEWIAEARRSRDLLAGSRILSWLMRGLLSELQKHGARIVTPEIPAGFAGSSLRDALAEEYSLPSRASGTLPAGPGIREDEAAPSPFLRLQEVLDQRWSELVDTALSGGFPQAGTLKLLVEPFLKNASNPFSLLWVVSAADTSGEPGLVRIDRLFQAVKRTRPVRAHVGAPVRKCGQCGRREAIGGQDGATWRKFRAGFDAQREVRLGLRFEPGELLCAVCAVKRLTGYLRTRAFPSTSEIAARLWRVESCPDLRQLLDALKRAARAVEGFDQDPWPLLYESGLRREMAKAAQDEARQDALGKVAAARRELVAAIQERDEAVPAEPSSYLAVMSFDGDGMGEAVQRDPEGMSRKLGAFAASLGGILKDFRAEAVYVGGDEGLVLAPVASALPLAFAVRQAWAGTVEAGGAEGEGSAPAPTLSMGLAIFHRERPLGGAIEAARAALARAKAVGERGPLRGRKNALAVACQTASGNAWTAVERWGDGWERLWRAVELLREDRLAAGWPYDVEALLRSCWEEGDEMREAIREEIRRITRRRLKGSKDPEAFRDLWEKDLRGPTWWSDSPSPEVAETIPGQLHLVALLAREAQGS